MKWEFFSSLRVSLSVSASLIPSPTVQRGDWRCHVDPGYLPGPVRHRRSLSPGGALFESCSLASCLVCLCTSCSATWMPLRSGHARFTVDVCERRHFSEANTWQTSVPSQALLAKRRSLQIHPLAARCLGFMRLTQLKTCCSEFVPVRQGLFVFTPAMLDLRTMTW